MIQIDVNGNYIKLYRSMTEWEWLSSPNTLAVWIWILLHANWKDAKWRGMTIKRGQLITSMTHISEDLNISYSAVRVALDHLRSTHEVSTQTARSSILITVEKWELYQSDKTDGSRLTAGQQQGSSRAAATIEERKKERNIYNPLSFSLDTVSRGEEERGKIEKYISDCGYIVNADALIAHYDKRNWEIKGKPITDIYSLIDEWEKRAREKEEARKNEGKSSVRFINKNLIEVADENGNVTYRDGDGNPIEKEKANELIRNCKRL